MSLILRGTFFLALFFTGVICLEGCWAEKASTISPAEKNKNVPAASPKTNSSPNNSMKNDEFTSHLPAGFNMPSDETGQMLLKEYGAVFVARGGAAAPHTVIFKDEAEVGAWQASVPVSKATIAGVQIELQTPAMDALKSAVGEAAENELTITPRGNDAARRSYAETEELWESRVTPGLKYWVEKGKLDQNEAAKIKALAPFEQVTEIFKLEKQGMFFSKDLSKPIIYSVAPPGASQHLSMLALDVVENDDPKIRELLARHGWFQTVVSDLPHFTFLGVTEEKLPGLGLKKTINGGRSFWIPE
jgi:hypothetical protein